MQTTQLRDHIVAGAQVKVVCVGEHERGAQFLDLGRRERLDRCLRADRRKDRCEQIAVRGGKDACTGTVVAGCDGKVKHKKNYTILVTWEYGHELKLAKTSQAQRLPGSYSGLGRQRR